MRAADIAVQPCHTLETLPNDEHLQAVGLIKTEEHPSEGKVAAIRSTVRFNDAYPPLREAAQPKGWETRAVLREAGYSEEEVKELMSAGAAVSTRP
jgi:crotonobetainyl-CoA:carnitine CoA-transferase CaiB-like acyl-CoA transferase